MVYKIFLSGESIDAEFGCPITIHETFTGKYGSALKRAEELLRLIDMGIASVSEKSLVKKDNPVYVANKVLTDSGIKVTRSELN